MDWFLYDNGLRHERVNKLIFSVIFQACFFNRFTSFYSEKETTVTKDKTSLVTITMSLFVMQTRLQFISIRAEPKNEKRNPFPLDSPVNDNSK